ncbi:ferric reductase like transmembrane component-domain-containing protein [Xylariomycetidae sp. FL0641]|nr:ferric reductase like transmembrane component-domain-containing protein [Xylariomycetidae sp. FL0641]
MDDMDMSGMGGMDMSGGDNMFRKTNMAYARGYWYAIAAFVAVLLLVRGINFAQYSLRLRTAKTTSTQYPTKPTNFFLQTWATMTAVGRELSYPQLYVPFRHLSWMTPPPTGRVLVLLAYWAVVIYMMAHGSVVFDAYFWERIGYRNAWVTVTQVPLIYLLASKTSVIGYIIGSSHERLNWLHRWVARTAFVTATVHGWHFWSEWVKFDMLEMELEMMTSIVPYGLGAWGILLWMTITSFKPFRSMAYELFVIQHVLAAVIFLWVVYVHVPEVARYNIWFAIAAICCDRVCRLAFLVWQNVRFSPKKSCCAGGQRIGHRTHIASVGESTTILTIKDVHFKWTAGQHLYLWLPRVGMFETHPFTIASSHPMAETCVCNSVQLVIRSHSGFSRRLNHFSRDLSRKGEKQETTALVMGPYGQPPRWDVFETLVLISASTGASYTLPILESALRIKAAGCTKRIDFLLATRQGEEIDFYLERLHEALETAKSAGIELTVHIAVTAGGRLQVVSPTSRSSMGTSTSSLEKAVPRGDTEDASNTEAIPSTVTSSRKRVSRASSDSHMHHSTSRPDIASLIRSAVEATGGETGVVVCGGQSLVAKTRTSVAKLSDERGVHKGTGAQGIHLHVEEYCF